MSSYNIRYIRGNQIDREAWDRCVETAANGSIYSYSWYLDRMADHWDGLVLNGYEAVMPLPWRKKWGISYLYPPFGTAQLGVLGHDLTAELLASFLQAVPPRFRYWDLPLNRGNRFAVPGFPLAERLNYVLPLHPAYELIYARYRENIRRNIRKSREYGCRPDREVDLEEVMVLSRASAGAGTDADYERFRALYLHLAPQGKAVTYGIRSGRQELLASAIFFFSHHRAYYILVGNHPNGRTLGASHALIDSFIRDHAGRDLTLDFEGSDLRNLAFFYSSFGATEERYASIRINRLPFYLRWLKQ